MPDRNMAVHTSQKKKENGECCATCRYRSDEFTSVCVNDQSSRCADFVEKDYWCPEYSRIGK